MDYELASDLIEESLGTTDFRHAAENVLGAASNVTSSDYPLPNSTLPATPRTAAPATPRTAAPAAPRTAAPVARRTAAPAAPRTAAPVARHMLKMMTILFLLFIAVVSDTYATHVIAEIGGEKAVRGRAPTAWGVMMQGISLVVLYAIATKLVEYDML
jgi:hypothetical protein